MNPKAAFILAVTTILIAAIGCIVSVFAHVPRYALRASLILLITGIIGLGISGAWIFVEPEFGQSKTAATRSSPSEPPRPTTAPAPAPSPSPEKSPVVKTPPPEITAQEALRNPSNLKIDGDKSSPLSLFDQIQEELKRSGPAQADSNVWASGYYHNKVTNRTNFLVTYKTIGPDGKWVTVALRPHTSKTQWWSNPDIAIIELVSVSGRPAHGRWKTETQFTKQVLTYEDPQARYLPFYRFEQNNRGEVELFGD